MRNVNTNAVFGVSNLIVQYIRVVSFLRDIEREREREMSNKKTILSQDGTCLEMVLPTLTHFVIPKTVKVIGHMAFLKSLIEEIVIPNQVTEICNGAFSYCKNLERVYVNMDRSDLKYIRRKAFFRCRRLISFELPRRTVVIGFKAFSGCTNLKDIYIRPSVSNIGKFAFSNCHALRESGKPFYCTHRDTIRLFMFGINKINQKQGRYFNTRVYQIVTSFIPIHTEPHDFFIREHMYAGPRIKKTNDDGACVLS